MTKPLGGFFQRDKSRGRPDKRSWKKTSRRERPADRRRRDLGKSPDGRNRRRSPGDRRKVLGDRRDKKFTVIPDIPTVYNLDRDG